MCCRSKMKLSEKCPDLEGRLKRQNLGEVGMKEEKEDGQKTKDLVAQMLEKALDRLSTYSPTETPW